MREILFRGKTILGKWIEGDLLQYLGCGKVYIAQYYKGAGGQEVIPETVGQYTGLTDKNGKKIFEGDIIKCISRFDAKDMVVIFETAEFHLVDCQRYKNYTECCGYRQFGTMETEVIGNIHDNPELLRGDTE